MPKSNKTYSFSQLVEDSRPSVVWFQHLRIALAMANYIAKVLSTVFLPAYFVYFSFSYFLSALAEWFIFFNEVTSLVGRSAKRKKGAVLSKEEREEDAAQLKKIGNSLSNALNDTIWGVANLFMFLFCVSIPPLAIGAFMGGCLYDLVVSAYTGYQQYKACKDPIEKEKIKKDTIVNVAVSSAFLVACIPIIILTAFIAVNPILLAAAAATIIVALACYRGWEFYKKCKKPKKADDPLEKASEEEKPLLDHSLRENNRMKPSPLLRSQSLPNLLARRKSTNDSSLDDSKSSSPRLLDFSLKGGSDSKAKNPLSQKDEDLSSVSRSSTLPVRNKSEKTLWTDNKKVLKRSTSFNYACLYPPSTSIVEKQTERRKSLPAIKNWHY